MHLILTGATGVIGTSVLAYIISASTATTTSRKVTHVSILTRNPEIPYLKQNPLPSNSPLKIDIIPHNDFESYPPAVLDRLKGAEGVVWALGISQTEVNKEQYVKITKDFTLKAFECFSNIPDKGKETGNFKFVYVSGEGATHKPGRLTPIFGRVKGETEIALINMAKSNPSMRAYNPRPGAVDFADQPAVFAAVKDKALNKFFKVVLYHTLWPLLNTVAKSNISPTKELGAALTDLALGNGEPITGKGVENGGWTITNVGLRRLAGL